MIRPIAASQKPRKSLVFRGLTRLVSRDLGGDRPEYTGFRIHKLFKYHKF